MYMREYGMQVHKFVYRHFDWSIIVPLQSMDLDLILKAAQKPVSSEGFGKLFLGTEVMLAFGYEGEAGVLEAWIGFVLGMCGWV